MGKRVSKQHTIEIIFPLFFILVFCLCVLLLILGGTGFYKKTVSGLEENYTLRTAIPYIQEKCRECPNCEQMEILQGEQGSVLAIYEEVDSVEYAVYIYEKDGYLTELYTKKSDTPGYDAGQKLVRMDHFDASWKEKGLLLIKLAVDGEEEIFCMSVRKPEESIS